MGLGDAEIGQQESHRLAAHRRAAVGVDGELIRQDDLLFGSFFDEGPGEFGALARCHHPTDDVATEDVQYHVEIEVGPLYGTTQLGDVPTPQLVGRGSQQFRFLVLGMSELIAAFARSAVLF